MGGCKLSVRKSYLNPLNLLNSVPLGITLMALTALYIAVGSGRPWLRDWGWDQWPILRSWFDLTDLQFFDAWPLKVLMGLLIATLVVVTWKRIPLTPPRYGVWCIHCGIIILILGTSYYYHRKLEGRIRLFVSPDFGAISTDHFYDKDERSLYVKVNDTAWNWYPLPGLPRFQDYDASLGNADALVRRHLDGIVPDVPMADDSGKIVTKSMSEWLGWKDPVSFDIVGYFPYAQIDTDFVDDPTSTANGIRMTLPDMPGQQTIEAWVVASDPRYRSVSQFGVEFEHRQADGTMLPALNESITKIFRLDLKLARPSAAAFADTVYVQPGQTYSLGQTGYSFTVESFDPAWSMFGTGEQVQALTLKITTPTQTFRRMVLAGKNVQTDFLLNVPGAPPIGKRQKEPVDKSLTIAFQFSDPYLFLPQQGAAVKHTLVTPPDGSLLDFVGSFDSPSEIRRFDGGSGDIQIAAQDADANHPNARIHLERLEHLRRVDSVRSVPPAQRDRNFEEEGALQVAKVDVHMGKWSQIVAVPFTDEAGDTPWDGGYVQLPGVNTTLQLQLGNTRRALPCRITLNNFELIPYPGGDVNNSRIPMLDFRSTLTVEDLQTGDQLVDVAHMNHPVYFRDGDWLFFQAAYDGQSRKWTQLGVGNRPGVGIMIFGCAMIFGGLAYAFYLKPVIIRRMKLKALAQAAGRERRPKPQEMAIQ